MKGKWVALLIICILLADQALKFYIKTNYYPGEEHKIVGNWFRLHFVENVGMAWGWEFGSSFGKIILTLFRLLAVIFGVFYLRSVIIKKYHKGFIVCAALIYAGALGNLIDSMFYGMIFNNGTGSTPAQFFPAGGGYAPFLHGKVVDMLYLPIITHAKFPTWFPVWGGQRFEFFNMVFNIADASISIGIITLLVWQRRFFPKQQPANTPVPETVIAIEENKQVL